MKGGVLQLSCCSMVGPQGVRAMVAKGVVLVVVVVVVVVVVGVCAAAGRRAQLGAWFGERRRSRTGSVGCVNWADRKIGWDDGGLLLRGLKEALLSSGDGTAGSM